MHRADRAAVVRAALAEAGIDPDDHDQFAVTGSNGRWSWEIVGRRQLDDRTYAHIVSAAITTRQRWRAEHEQAKGVVAARDGPTAAAA